ncbi:hypothetical protein D1Y71_27885 (plasmid) [Klebsiella pneumoniae]|nr:hypothetical protein D1Y71_27885 [Klebsiella pneumoniae]HBT5060025.1 hypothetical protein [Klebsiella pneumoniae]HBT5087622.1 hypothetical protein [Klebsiella pneumoniae]HBT5590951.1 hypothetical protein [Klebsiella pneumoniae]HBX7208197.1 hypothetical protein [Klebsiella pneumoniae]
MTGSAYPTPFPAKPYPRKTSQECLYAIGVVPARRQPQSGRISALAGRRAAYERVTAGKWRRRPVQPAAALR